MSLSALDPDPGGRRPPLLVPPAGGVPENPPTDDVPENPPAVTESSLMDEIVPETQPEEEDDLEEERNKSSTMPESDVTRQREGSALAAANETERREADSGGTSTTATEHDLPAELKRPVISEQVSSTSGPPPNASDDEVKVDEEDKPSATTEQLAAALQHSLQTASYRKPRLQAWLDLVQQLFEKVFPKSPVKRLNLSAAAQRLPRLRKPELERLVDVFEAIVVNQHQDWTAWTRIVVDSCHTVYKSRQSLEYVLSKEIGRVSVQNAVRSAPELTQWAQKVSGPQEGAAEISSTTKEFLFNQRVYSPEETTHLRTVCAKTYGKHSQSAFRDGTEDEWRIVQGIVEGTIICRRLPQFFNRIMRTEDKLRVIGTVRAQVEGMLVMDLDGELPVKEAFQSTKNLQESISIAAMNRNAGNQQLWSLLAAVKTISYNAAKHEIHFHFFTREAAKRFDGLEIPFHRAPHKLVNAHPTRNEVPGSTVWDLQYEEDGALISTATEYVVTLRNVTRTIDLGRLHAFLKHVLNVPFLFEDMDQSGPQSSTSTAWELSFAMDGCPRALEGVRRIIWFTSVIVVQHPSMRGRQQCLRCGDLGHPMRACYMTLEALRGPGCLLATDETIATLPAQPPTFTSLAELRSTVAAGRQSPASVESQTNGTDSSQGAATSEACPDETPSRQDAPRKATSSEPKEDWFDGGSKKKPSRSSLKPLPSSQPPCPRGSQHAGSADNTSKAGAPTGPMTGAHNKAKAGSRFNPLIVDSSDEKVSQEDERKKWQSAKQKPTATDIRRAHAELLVAEDTAKEELTAALAQVPTTAHRPAHHATRSADLAEVDLEKSLPTALNTMGLQPVSTPRSGNCQVFSVAQALANDSFSDEPDRMAQVATALKKGCTARALIDFPLKYPHAQRKQTLLQLGRGYEKMTQPVSEEEFRRYLTEYGSSPSDPAVFVPGKLWGSNDTLAAYGTMLQRDIFVISFVPGKSMWSALHYEPETRHTHNKVFSTCGEFPLSAEGCVKKVLELKQKAGPATDKLPLVLHYHNKHYSAYVHGATAGAAHTQQEKEEDVEMAGSDEEAPSAERASGSGTPPGSTKAHDTGTGDSPPETRSAGGMNEETRVTGDVEMKDEQQYGSQSPWDPEAWDGNMEEVAERMGGPTIHHALKQEIGQILRVGGERTQELLHFLDATVSQLSLPQQQQLLAADLSDPDQCKEFMTEFQIPEPVVHQWRRRLEEEKAGETPVEEPALPRQDLSDPDYYPSSSQSSENFSTPRATSPRRLLKRTAVPAGPGKRAHTTTPVERREEAGVVVNVNNRAVPLKKRNSDDPTKNLLTMFEEADEPSRESPTLNREGEPTWPQSWSAYVSAWAQQTSVPLPTVEAPVETWLLAAKQERTRLLYLLRSFSHSHEIVRLMAPQVLIELTAPWRDECWQKALEAGQLDENATPTRVRRLARWGRKAEQADDDKGRRAIMNSSDEWAIEKTERYGGNALMWLCAPQRISRLSHYLLFAHIYAEKVAAMLGEDSQAENSAESKLQRHLTALQKIPSFKAAFLTADKKQSVKWESIGRYMALVVDDGADSHRATMMSSSFQLQY